MPNEERVDVRPGMVLRLDPSDDVVTSRNNLPHLFRDPKYGDVLTSRLDQVRWVPAPVNNSEGWGPSWYQQLFPRGTAQAYGTPYDFPVYDDLLLPDDDPFLEVAREAAAMTARRVEESLRDNGIATILGPVGVTTTYSLSDYLLDNDTTEGSIQ